MAFSVPKKFLAKKNVSSFTAALHVSDLSYGTTSLWTLFHLPPSVKGVADVSISSNLNFMVAYVYMHYWD
jgi:hypothetical protein